MDHRREWNGGEQEELTPPMAAQSFGDDSAECLPVMLCLDNGDGGRPWGMIMDFCSSIVRDKDMSHIFLGPELPQICK